MQPEPVRSGTFRIDRRRAFEMLSRFQLATPQLFPLPWVRAAMACGATAIEACDVADRFELRFDGRPFASRELNELLASLPAEQADPRLQELARGAFCALAAGIDFVSVRTGPPGARFFLRLTAESEGVEPVSDVEPRTVVGVVWPAGGRPAVFDAGIEALRRQAFPGILHFSGEAGPVVDLPEGYWEPLSADGLRGWLAPGRRGLPSELFLHKLGMGCGRETVELPGPQVRAVVEDDGLELTLSQQSVAKDEAFQSMLARLGPAVESFALRKTQELSRILPAIGGWLRDPQAYARWKASVAGLTDPGGVAGVFLEAQRAFALDAGTAADRRFPLDTWAPVVGWIRDTALRVFGDGRPRKTEFERALWSVPLYLSYEGLPVTLDELESQRLRFKRLTVGERKFSGEDRLSPTIQVADRREMLELLAGPVGDRLTL